MQILRKMATLVLGGLCFLLLSVHHGCGQDSEASFQAGAYPSNITPWLGEPIVGGWGSPIAEHIHDQLWAKCLVLDDGETRLVFVICDSLGIPKEVYEKAKEEIHEITGIPIENMMMAATHTHSSLSAYFSNRLKPDEEFSEYQEFMIDRIVDGVQCAIQNLEPAEVGWGTTEEPREVFNRRWLMEPGDHLRNPFGGMDEARMNPPRQHEALIKPAGPIDPEIVFFSIRNQKGNPLALLANYSLHYVGTRKSNVISADYFAVFAERMEELLRAAYQDPPFVGLMTNGTSGDINNINFQKPYEREEPYEKMKEVAYNVAQKVYEAHREVQYQEEVKLDARKMELSIGVRKPTPGQLAYMKKVMARDEDEPMYHSREKVYAERLFKLMEAPDRIGVPIQTFRIGEMGICAIPFEVLVEIGLEIKDRSPFDPTFTISHANGSYGYLPTRKQHRLGGYETWLGTNNVEVKAADRITEGILHFFEEMHEAK